MAMTVAELLAEPQLGLTLIAGGDGLENRITWAHTSDLPRLWEWVTGGELMMTNGMSIPADAEGQVALAEALVAAGASALAIGDKMHAPQLQPELLAACDELAFPLLSIPYPLPFIAIARSVAESTMLEESQRLRQTARMYDLLRQTGTSGEQWRGLVDGIASNLDAQVYVVNRRCLHPWHAEDEPLPERLVVGQSELLRTPVDQSKQFLGTTVAARRPDDGCPDPSRRGAGGRAADAHASRRRRPAARRDGHRPGAVAHHPRAGERPPARRGVPRPGARRTGRSGRVREADRRVRPDGEGCRGRDAVRRGRSAARGCALLPVAARDGIGRHPSPEQAASAPVREGHEQVLRHVVDPGVRVGVSRVASVDGLQRALQESLWALATAESVREPFMRYAEGPSWLGLTSFEEGEALVERLLGPVLEYEAGHQPDLILTLKTYRRCSARRRRPPPRSSSPPDDRLPHAQDR